MDLQFQPFLDLTLLGDTVLLTSADQNDKDDEINKTSSLSSCGCCFARSGAAGCMKTSSGVKRSNSSITASSNRSVASQNSENQIGKGSGSSAACGIFTDTISRQFLSIHEEARFVLR